MHPKVIDLSGIPYVLGTRYAQEKGCLARMRGSFLAEIRDVLNNLDKGAPRVCLLTGVVGSGKSAVAHTISRLYDRQKRPGSLYCFSRTDVTRESQPKKSFRHCRTRSSPFEQLEKLIIESSQYFHLIGPLVVVIDALDESGTKPVANSFYKPSPTKSQTKIFR